MSDRATLPEPPDVNTRRIMATHFSVSDRYDCSPAANVILHHIEAGNIAFWLPDHCQLTKQGYDVLRATEGLSS